MSKEKETKKAAPKATAKKPKATKAAAHGRGRAQRARKKILTQKRKGTENTERARSLNIARVLY